MISINPVVIRKKILRLLRPTNENKNPTNLLVHRIKSVLHSKPYVTGYRKIFPLKSHNNLLI